MVPCPDDCPPKDALDAPKGFFLRLVPAEKCAGNDFLSGHVENRKKPRKCDDCTWMACSVFISTTPREKLADLAKLPNLSDKKFIAHIAVDPSCGRIKPHPKDPEHLSFWMYETFTVEKSVVKIEPL